MPLIDLFLIAADFQNIKQLTYMDDGNAAIV